METIVFETRQYRFIFFLASYYFRKTGNLNCEDTPIARVIVLSGNWLF